MSSLVITKPEKMAQIKKNVDALIIHDAKIKEMFFESFKNGDRPEQIGNSFEQSLARPERRGKGQYYTPKIIVEYMISQLKINKDSKILDPACGCGSFLLTVFDICKARFSADFLENIYGVDLNKKAIQITRACLFAKADFEEEFLDTVVQNIKTGNSIVTERNIDNKAFEWKKEFSDVFQNGGFDFIIGNPPYVTLRQSREFNPLHPIYSKIVNGPVNAATLMIGRSLDLLKESGVLAFLLPKSILYVDSYTRLREYILQKTEILQIFDLGAKFKDVRGEQIILILRKKSNKHKAHSVKVCIFDEKEKDLNSQPSVMVTQQRFKDLNKFLTFGKKEYYDLILKLTNKGSTLDSFVNGKIFRGLPIGGNHINNESGSDKKRVIRGKNIDKFFIKEPYLIDKHLLDRQSQSKVNLLRNQKIVLQNIFSAESGVKAAFDTRGLLSLDTVTNILVESDEQGKYILALLSSKLINFYLMYAMFGRSKLTMHLDKSYIGRAPVSKTIKRDILIKLKRIVESAMDCDDADGVKRENKKIDELVYALYEVSGKEITIVENAVAGMLSRKSLW